MRQSLALALCLFATGCDIFDYDVVRSDLAIADLATDLSAADLAASDLSQPDLGTSDLATPDLATPDLSRSLDLPPPCTSSFTAASDHSDVDAGAFPTAIAVGDFNRDGKLDAITANYGFHSVSVLVHKNLFTQTFAAAVEYTVGLAPIAVAVADLNRDGALDIVSANAETTVSVLLGVGDGTFNSQLTFSIDTPDHPHPNAVAVGDVNQDGIPDIVTGNTTSTITVLTGTGMTPTMFSAPASIAVNGVPSSVAIGDVTGDGKPDILFTFSSAGSSFVGVLARDPMQPLLFLPEMDYPTGASPHSIAVGDFNSDGSLDVATTHYGTAVNSALNVLLNNGEGSFQMPVSYPTGSLPRSSFVGDFNKDGSLDIVVANSDLAGNRGSTAELFLNLGDGIFQDAGMFSTGSSPWGIVGGDFNGDGKLDVATANYGGDSVSLLLGQHGVAATEISGTPQTFGSGSGFAYTAVVTGDFDRDGMLDVAAPGHQQLEVWPGNGGTPSSTSLSGSVGAFPQIATADFDLDGNLDLVTVDQSSHLFVLYGNGTGGFAPHSYTVGADSTGVVVGDWNRDGWPDIAVVANNVLDNLDVAMNGGGQTGQSFTVESRQISMDVFTSVATADWNRDGKLDLIVGGSSQIHVLLGSGDSTATFTDSIDASPPLFVQALALSDFNRDGKLDIVAATNSSQSGHNDDFAFVLLHSASDDQIDAATSLNYGTAATSVWAGDLDGDGDPDVVIEGTDHLIEYSNDGIGNLTPGAFNPPTSSLPNYRGVTAVDWNRDGLVDIISVRATTLIGEIDVYTGVGVCQ